MILLSSSIVVALSIVAPIAHAELERQTPGIKACATLTAELGSSKVIGKSLNPQYLLSQFEYWNAKQSQYSPSCIVYPLSAFDVSIALKTIKSAGSRFAIKAGGHNPNTFFSSVNNGVLVDLTNMINRTYDATSTIGTYQPGGTFGDVYQYFAQYNRTVVGARLAGVGTGLGLGGGLSYLSPQYGLACDSFRELEVVLPNGSIVTASPMKNPDLFFAMRGGGGNAYGVVTKYTIQTRPAGTFYAGNIIYAFEQVEALHYAIANFTLYNTDPKASIIGTYEKTNAPSFGLDLDDLAIMFLVYDGPDAGHAFDNFTALPSLINTLGPKTYLEVVNLPFPGTTVLSRADNIFRVQAHHLNSPDGYTAAFSAWAKWAEANKDLYTLTSIDFQPIPKSLTDASHAQNGGNAMNMPSGPWLWLNFLITTPTTLTPAQYRTAQTGFRKMVASVPSAKGLPLFINDANYDQNPLQTFSTFQKLKGIKDKYDPDGFFANYTGGWNFNA